MRYKLLVLIFIINFIQSCTNKEKKKPTFESLFKKVRTTRDSLELIEKNKLYNLKLIKKKESDSINKIQEKVALGNINFGISKKEYLIKEKEFKKITGRRLGEFKFGMREGYNENGGLSFVILKGLGVNYDYYQRDMLKQFKSIKEILFEKYGEPIVQNEFPYWSDFEKNDKKNIFYWKIGNKSIWVDIENTYSNRYELSITFGYSSPERLNKLRKEKERKEKELKNNAVKNL
jgi:hypothetical protein